MEDNIYTVGDARQADRYTKTTEAIANYIQRTYDHGQDVKDAIITMQQTDLKKYEPQMPKLKKDQQLDELAKMLLQQDVKDYGHRKTKYADNMNKAYALIHGQCTQGMKNKLEARKDWTTIEANHNPIELLKAIKEITLNYQDSRYPIASIFTSLSTLFNMKQEEKESLTNYSWQFKNAKDIMETQHGKLTLEKFVENHPNLNTSGSNKDDLTEKSYNQLIAYIFISGADSKKSGDLVKNLSNDYALGNDKYPKDLAAAMNSVANYKSADVNCNKKRDDKNNSNENSSNETQLGFMQGGRNRNGRGGRNPNPNIKCHRCGERGHIAAKCTAAAPANQATSNAQQGSNENTNDNTNAQQQSTRSVQLFCQDGITMQAAKHGFDDNYLRGQLLLDNQSTTDIWCRPELLENVREVEETLQLKTNAGTLTCNTMGDVPGYGPVWCDERAITNIISMSNAEKSGRFKISYDSRSGFKMKNLQSGNITTFKRDASGLFTTPVEYDVAMLNTVEENKSLYTKRQVARADEARKLYGIVGYPSMKDFKHIIQTNQIKNCPVTIEDIKISEKIYGPSVYAIKGKSVRKKPKVVVNDYIEIPRELIKAHQGIILCADIMYIEEVPFLVTVSKNVRMNTIRYIPDKKKQTLLEAFDPTLLLYNKAGFTIKELHADPEFECIREEMEINDIKVNLTAAEEHQPDVERAIRTIKERFRAIYHSCPYSCWPKLMIIRGASYAVKWLNTFPPKGGISTTYSPRAIIEGRPVEFNKHCKLSFGSYVQAVTQSTNTPAERAKDGIFLRTLDNQQGGYEVLNLATGKPVTRHELIEIPITSDVIKKVEQLAKRDGFKPHHEPIFRTYALLAGVDDDTDSISDDDTYSTTSSDSLDDEDDESIDSIDPDEIADLADDRAYIPGVPAPNQPAIMQEEQQEDNQSIASSASEASSNLIEEDPVEEVESDNESVDSEPVPEPPRRTSRITMPRATLDPSFGGQMYDNDIVDEVNRVHSGTLSSRGWNHLITQVYPTNTLEYEPAEAELLANIIEHSLVQTYNLKQGINKFGERGEQSALAEMKQLHDREAFRPIDITKYGAQARRNAMESLIFIVEKRDGRIKARTVANGSKQRTWMSKEDAASPTVMLESVMLSAIIDAKEGREVAVVDIPNAFVQTANVKLKDDHQMDIMKIKGRLAEILVSIAPEVYAPYVVYEKGVPVIYVEIMKALYGMIKAALLFYRKLRKDLETKGFKINPYDICVANKMVNGKQLTVMWHVDDLKCSHVDTAVIDKFIEWTRDMYEDEEITKIKPSRGKVHDYLGITLDYSIPGKVKLHMKDYIKNIFEEFPYMDQVHELRHVSTPAAEHLFTVNDKAEKLNSVMSEDFHTTVAKILFLCKRTRPDLQPTIPFLCTRVKSPDVDDWKKLIRMMKYLYETKELVLTLEAEGGDIFICKWYPDAAFAVHPDMKSHTGGVFTAGKGAINTISAKQKLNTRSSTEAELVAADDITPQAIWTRNFLKEQGYESSTTIYQDNTSAMLLETNGMESSSKRTRHINIRYYFIKDCIDKQILKIEYCPTDDMIGDYPSKPLQGRKFKKHRKTILNLDD